MNLRNRKFLLLLSKGMSVEKWDNLGMLSRELDIYSRLAKYFQEVWWYTYGRNDYKYKDKLGVIKLFIPEKDIFRVARDYDEYDKLVLNRYHDFFREFGYVKTNQFSSGKMALNLKKRFGLKFILRLGYFTPLYFKFLSKNVFENFFSYISGADKRIYKSADIILVTSAVIKKNLVGMYNICEKDIIVIPNGVNIDVFKPSRFSIKNKNSLLYIGRFSFEKNLMSLLRAIVGIPVSLTLVGSGRYQDRVVKFANKFRIKVTILNRVDNYNLVKLYNSHAIFVLPSFYEGCPKVLLEAMACELPCIGSKVYGIREIIRHKINGYLCGTTPKSIRNAIIELLSNKILYERIKNTARKTVLENFNLKRLIEKEIRIYESL